jgi:hypothetical protein
VFVTVRRPYRQLTPAAVRQVMGRACGHAGAPVSALRDRAEEYLAMRRTLGFKLTTFGSRLMSFVGSCENTALTA